MDAIILHGIWFMVGFFCGMVVMSALALSSAISRMEEEPVTLEDDEPPTPTVVIQDSPQTLAMLAESQSTARFYQSLYQNLADTVKRA